MAHGGDKRISVTTSELEFWKLLPPEVQDTILAHLPLNHLFQTRLVCKDFYDVIKRGAFSQTRARLCLTECSLSPLVIFWENGTWKLRGFDYEGRIWIYLPSLRYPIPAPDPDSFKDFHVAGHKGLICLSVEKASEGEELYICNSLTGETFKLPALKYSRHPAMLSVHVNLITEADTVSSSYLVIAAGSAASRTGSLSRKTEVFDSDSSSGEWEVAGDVPGADFSLDDYQTGVYCERQNLLLCVGSKANGQKCIVTFNVVEREWREDRIYPLYYLHPLVTIYFAQVVKCNEKFYVFTVQSTVQLGYRKVMHCIDRLDMDIGSGEDAWKRLVTQPRDGDRAVMEYPEYTCVPVGENKLCFFDTVNKSGVVYDLVPARSKPLNRETLPSPTCDNGTMSPSLREFGNAYEPTFVASPFPRSNVASAPQLRNMLSIVSCSGPPYYDVDSGLSDPRRLSACWLILPRIHDDWI